MDYLRQSGILLHPTSLPGRYGIGTFNDAAYEWVDFLVATRQSLWQVLPLSPTGYGDSPYQSFSSFAGNPYLISLEAMLEEGLLSSTDLADAPHFEEDKVDYGLIYTWKMPLLRRAAVAFAEGNAPELQAEFTNFCQEQSSWLDDFALFMALKDVHNGAAWNTWGMDLRGRKASALAQAQQEHADAIHNHKFNQWLFFRQWSKLKAY